MMATSATTSSVPNPGMQTSERRCENPDCNVNKLISMVPKRKTSQFVSEPVVIEKPMLVNGFTAVFQVDGPSAKLLDIKNPNGGEGQSKAIYRIIPNSHVHVVNYVVVDTDETYLRKITENDPATMQKLLTSQKESADQMLKKIMLGQGSSATAAMTTVVSTINNNNVISNNDNILTQAAATMSQKPSAQVTTQPASVSGTHTHQKTAIKLPVRMHPNLKITAVASAEGVTASTMTSNLSSNTTGNSFLTPVPLTNLQQGNTSTGVNTMNPIMNTSTIDTVDKPTYDKMQAEINDLRRTVAMLAEAQAKNQKPKRPRSNAPK